MAPALGSNQALVVCIGVFVFLVAQRLRLCEACRSHRALWQHRQRGRPTELQGGTNRHGVSVGTTRKGPKRHSNVASARCVCMSLTPVLECTEANGLPTSVPVDSAREACFDQMASEARAHSFHDISPLFADCTIEEAAKRLGVCVTYLKLRCRELGIPRWPHRQARALIERPVNALRNVK